MPACFARASFFDDPGQDVPVPGGHQIRHLEAHHLVPWILGGLTDLDNLILLCRWHHTAVHERRGSINRDGNDRLFTKPDGQPCDWWVDEETWPGIWTSRYAAASSLIN